MKNIRLFLALGLTVASISAAHGAGLLNPNFETPVINSPTEYYTTAPAGFGWTIVPGTGIDQVRSFWQPASGAQSIDLNGFSPGSIYQDFGFASAGAWTILFDLAGNPEGQGVKTVRVDFGLSQGPLTSLGTFTFDSTGHTLGNMGWVTITTPAVNVDTFSSYRLQFTSLTDGATGPALDNIRLQIVPEPGSLALLSIGSVVGLIHFFRRNRNCERCSRS